LSKRNIVDVEKPTIAQKRFDVEKMADLLEQAYLSGRREPSDRAKISFAPSGIGYGAGVCPRRWYYDFEGGVLREEDSDAMGIANMSYGTEAHARLQDVFKQADILVEAERTVSTRGVDGQPPIFGFADLIIDWQGEEAVGEIKTTSQESYVSKKSKNAPAGYHLLQVLIYMKVLELNKGFIVYENKNMQNLLILPVTWNVANTKLADDTWDWMTKVYDNWKAEGDTLPKRPFRSVVSKACKSCPFNQHCWNDENDGVVDLPILEVPK
jgi:CRISPR/Cas system-associated exonuclease Cas4 (RecB family)